MGPAGSWVGGRLRPARWRVGRVCRYPLIGSGVSGSAGVVEPAHQPAHGVVENPLTDPLTRALARPLTNPLTRPLTNPLIESSKNPLTDPLMKPAHTRSDLHNERVGQQGMSGLVSTSHRPAQGSCLGHEKGAAPETPRRPQFA